MIDTHTILHHAADIVTGTVSITCLVMVMMLLIEFVNVSSSGRILSKLQKRPYLQILIASLLGLIPGCIGGFTIVSLYTHRLLSFGALVAGMISTFGDSAFLLFAVSPRTAPILLGSLFVVALIAGFITHLLFRNRPFYNEDTHTLELHQEHAHDHGSAQLAWKNVRQVSFSRAVLIFGLLLYLIALGTGAISHEHGSMPDMEHFEVCETGAETHDLCCEHSHHHHGDVESHEESHLHGENMVFGILALLTLVVVAFCSEHFLQEHLWQHVIKHHFISVLLWTFGVLLCLDVLNFFVDLEILVENNRWVTWMLLFIALAVGIIPESQPQFLWIYLYAAGVLPFSILLASSIVQDGHGALPLLAYSRKSFFMMKAANIFFGLLVGLIGLAIGI